MLSGVGDPEELRRHSILMKLALPGVGKNLQDHASVILMYRRKEPSPFLGAMRADRIARALPQAYFLGTGFASDVPGGVVAFLKSRSEAPLPDLQILLTAASLGGHLYFAPFKPPSPTCSPRASCCCTGEPRLRRPQVRRSGRASGHPAEPALDRRGSAHAARGHWLTREIAAQPSMAPFVAAEAVLGLGKASDGEIDAYMRATAITVHHPLGTCRMGAASTNWQWSIPS